MKTTLILFSLILSFTVFGCDNWDLIPPQVIDNGEEDKLFDMFGVIQEFQVPIEPNFLLLDMISENILYLGTKSGEVYFSSNGGINWTLSKSLGYKVNVITSYAGGALVGTEGGLYLFGKTGSFEKVLIPPVDSLNRTTKINDIKISLNNRGEYVACTCYGFDGMNNIFKSTGAVNPMVNWVRSKSTISTSSVPLEFICSDSKVTSTNEFEVYLRASDSSIVYSSLSNGSYISVKTSSLVATSVSISKMYPDYVYLGTKTGLVISPSKFMSSYSYTQFSGKEILTVFSSSKGSVYLSSSEGCYYSLNNCLSFEKLYFNDRIDKIVRFYENDGHIYALDGKGFLHKFLDLMTAVQTPIIISPMKNELVSNDVVFKWYGVKYSDSLNNCYQIQVSRSSRFDDIIIDRNNIYSNTYQIGSLDAGAGGEYYWRVRNITPKNKYMWTGSQFRIKN